MFTRIPLGLVAGMLLLLARGFSATLTGSYADVPSGSNVDLTEEGSLDWVHWGLVTETSVNRKANVPPLIGGIKLVDATNGFAYLYQYADNYNGYSWRDGMPVISVTNTPTGVWVYGTPARGSGFEFSVPADTAMRTLKVFVGSFAARGQFSATLSDASAPAYTNTSLSNAGNGPGAVHTIDYAASSSGQSLTIRWILTQVFRGDGNVTLQAAALSAPGVDNPPFAVITNPTHSDAHSAGAALTIRVDSFDPDGSVAGVEFFVGSTKLGEDASQPYTLDWIDVPPGRHLITAKATDMAGSSRLSSPVELFAHTGGGTLTGAVAIPSTSVDLTFDGSLDWSHWGLLKADSFNHKAIAAPLIGNFIRIGTNEIIRLQDSFSAYHWSDGTPVAVTNSSRTGVYIRGATNGFTLSAPADTGQRTLQIHVGMYGVRSLFQAYLSDFSAPVYANTSLDSIYGSAPGVFTLTYSAASAGQSLIVRYTTQRAYDELYGNVTLQAATLAGREVTQRPPTVALTSPTNQSSFLAPANIVLEATAWDVDGSVTNVAFFEGGSKLGEDASSPYTLVWSGVPAGAYTLVARATDDSGAVATSNPVQLTVVDPVTLEPVTILNSLMTEAGFTFSFSTQSNRTYEVQFSDSLSPIDWRSLTNLAGTGAELTVTESSTGASERFFRVRTQ